MSATVGYRTYIRNLNRQERDDALQQARAAASVVASVTGAPFLFAAPPTSGKAPPESPWRLYSVFEGQNLAHELLVAQFEPFSLDLHNWGEVPVWIHSVGLSWKASYLPGPPSPGEPWVIIPTDYEGVPQPPMSEGEPIPEDIDSNFSGLFINALYRPIDGGLLPFIRNQDLAVATYEGEWVPTVSETVSLLSGRTSSQELILRPGKTLNFDLTDQFKMDALNDITAPSGYINGKSLLERGRPIAVLLEIRSVRIRDTSGRIWVQDHKAGTTVLEFDPMVTPA